MNVENSEAYRCFWRNSIAREPAFLRRQADPPVQISRKNSENSDEGFESFHAEAMLRAGEAAGPDVGGIFPRRPCAFD